MAHPCPDFVRKTNVCIFLIGKGILIEGIILVMEKKCSLLLNEVLRLEGFLLTFFFFLTFSLIHPHSEGNLC